MYDDDEKEATKILCERKTFFVFSLLKRKEKSFMEKFFLFFVMEAKKITDVRLV